MKNQKNIDNKVKMWGLSLFGSHREQLLTQLLTQVEKGKTWKSVVTPNPEQIIQSQTNAPLRKMLQTADWVLPDGVGLVLASRLLSSRLHQEPLQHVIPGRLVVSELLKLALARHWHCVLVGGQGYAGNRTTAVLDVQGTSVEWLSGYQFVQQPTDREEQQLSRCLLASKPDVLFVAFGAPAQETWILSHRALLEKSGVKLVMAVGGSFDTLLGKVPTPPDVIHQIGMEWLFRLILQPWRWRRQLRLIRFVWLVGKTWLNPSLSTRLD